MSFAVAKSERTFAMLDFSIGERTWDDIGEEICHHPDFPDQTNVEFVHILGSVSDSIHQIAIRIYERGVGPTTSSGTGTSAAATALIGVYGASTELDVIAPGGMQTVRGPAPARRSFSPGPRRSSPTARHGDHGSQRRDGSLCKPKLNPKGAGISVLSPASFAKPERVDRGLERSARTRLRSPPRRKYSKTRMYGTVVDDAVSRPGIDRISNVIANRWPVLLESEMVSDIHVARLQHVDGPRICRSLAIVLYSLLLNHFFNIRSARHPNRGERPANQHLVRMNAIPTVFILVIEAR